MENCVLLITVGRKWFRRTYFYERIQLINHFKYGLPFRVNEFYETRSAEVVLSETDFLFSLLLLFLKLLIKYWIFVTLRP